MPGRDMGFGSLYPAGLLAGLLLAMLSSMTHSMELVPSQLEAVANK